MAATRYTLNPPDTWVDRYGDALYSMALFRVRDEAAAQDLVQETFTAALGAREKFKGNSSEKTWLFGILKHKIMDWFRKKYRDAIFDHAPEGLGATDEWFDRKGHWKDGPALWADTPERLLEHKRFLDIVRHCMDSLPKRQAHVLSMRTLDGNTTEQICKVLKISATNCWVILHRARALMRQCVEGKWTERKTQTGADR